MGLWWDLRIGKIWDVDLFAIPLRDTIGLYWYHPMGWDLRGIFVGYF